MLPASCFMCDVPGWTEIPPDHFAPDNSRQCFWLLMTVSKEFWMHRVRAIFKVVWNASCSELHRG
jgi:hypothetical protein